MGFKHPLKEHPSLCVSTKATALANASPCLMNLPILHSHRRFRLNWIWNRVVIVLPRPFSYHCQRFTLSLGLNGKRWKSANCTLSSIGMGSACKRAYNVPLTLQSSPNPPTRTSVLCSPPTGGGNRNQGNPIRLSRHPVSSILCIEH